jgi:hypothetical protein
VPSELLKQGLLYPLQSNILEAEFQTAARVAKLVFDSALATVQTALIVSLVDGRQTRSNSVPSCLPVIRPPSNRRCVRQFGTERARRDLCMGIAFLTFQGGRIFGCCLSRFSGRVEDAVVVKKIASQAIPSITLTLRGERKTKRTPNLGGE